MNTLDGDRILSELNDRIQAKGLEAMTTAAVLSHDRIRQRLHFCYAGHPPAMVWRRAPKGGPTRESGGTWRRQQSAAGRNAPARVRSRPISTSPPETESWCSPTACWMRKILTARLLEMDVFATC